MLGRAQHGEGPPLKSRSASWLIRVWVAATILGWNLAVCLPLPSLRATPWPAPAAVPQEEVMTVRLDLGTNDDSDPVLEVARWWITAAHQLDPTWLGIEIDSSPQYVPAQTTLEIELVDADNEKPQVVDRQGKPRGPWTYQVRKAKDSYKLDWNNCRLDPAAGRVFKIRVSIPSLETSAMTEPFVIERRR